MHPHELRVAKEGPECTIIVAVDHLNDLAQRMKSKGCGFKEKDVANIDIVIEAITELEGQRSVVTDQLEAESIKCSILRHELKFLPDQYKQEIYDAVVNARQSNKDLFENLTEKLKTIDESIESLTKRQDELEKENTSLMPERDLLRSQHEEIISVLNVRMAEKAAKQIALNETRDHLRGTNQKIMDLEDDLLQLKEDMIKERAEARAEKANLRQSIDETIAKTAEQTKENMEAKAQLDVLLKRALHTEGELEDLRKFIRTTDANRMKSEGQERALTHQISKQTRDNDDLRKNIIDLQRKKMETQHKYESDIESMTKRLGKASAEIAAKQERKLKLAARVKELAQESDLLVEKWNESQQQIDEVSGILNEAKTALVRKTEDVAKLREEITRMEAEIIELGESHVVCVENFNRQIEEYKEQAGKERKERMEVQQKRDAVQKNLEEFKSSNTKFMAQINRKVTHGKQKHEDLTHEGTELQKAIRTTDEKIAQAKLNIRTERINYDLKKSELEEKLTKLQREIHTFEVETNKAKEIIAETVPVFEQRTREFHAVSENFEVIKKEVAGKKFLKASLEDQVKRTRAAITKVVKPMEEIRKEIKVCNETFLDNMKLQMDEAKELEKEIYVVGTKLQTLSEENHRFRNSNLEFESEIAQLTQDNSMAYDDIERLRAQYAFLKKLLYEAWGDDSKMEKENTDRDMDVLNKLADILKISSRRTEVVTNISDDMQHELVNLSNFLDNIATRRPRDESNQNAAVNTVGEQHLDRGNQPSQTFLKRQAYLDELAIIVPTDRYSSEIISENKTMARAKSAEGRTQSAEGQTKSEEGRGKSAMANRELSATKSSRRDKKPASAQSSSPATPRNKKKMSRKDPLPPIASKKLVSDSQESITSSSEQLPNSEAD